MIEQLTILSPGQLGGSVARAARERHVASRIAIWGRDPEKQAAISKQPWCDFVAATPGDAVQAASLVVIAAPVDHIVRLLKEIAPHLPNDAIVTDVGSVKGEIALIGQTVLGGGRFVGSHPMAGSEKSGWENSSANLFEGRTCFVTPLPKTDPEATALVEDFWRQLGGIPIRVDPHKHDKIVAHISHLPQLLASTLGAFLAEKDPAWRTYAGGGLRDTTRIAASDSDLWRTILEKNREEVLIALRGMQAKLADAESALEHQDWDKLVAILKKGRQFRTSFPVIGAT